MSAPAENASVRPASREPALATLPPWPSPSSSRGVGRTWWRLFRGADLVDEAFSVLVPWRWALGDRPFVDEQNLSQSAGLITYPFVKLYALIGGNDPTGLVLYERHLYLGLGCSRGVRGAVARRSLPGALAALVARPS